MKLSEYRREPVRRSCVDMLPADVQEQLREAKRTRSHNVPEMIEWLRMEGFESVTASALHQWFDRDGVRAES